MLKLVYKFLIFVFNFGEVLCVDLKKIIKIFKYFNRILLVFSNDDVKLKLWLENYLYNFIKIINFNIK